MSVLKVDDLTKKFGQFVAVNDISFELEEGEILGFLGPNGAGKTTTLQMLVGSLTPTSGEITYFGKSLFKKREEILDQINYSTTYTSLPWNLSVKENLTFISYLYTISNRKKRLGEIIEIFKLQDLLKQTVGSLSAGQKTRVNLAKSFLNYPKVLLLDEPTASLDPDIAKYLRDFILEERKEYKVSILFTSHNMKEVEEICDRVIFINGGSIISNDTPINLAKKINMTQIELLPENPKQLTDFCLVNKNKYTQTKKYVTISLEEHEIPKFLQQLAENKILYYEISINKPTLEDYFLKASKGGFDETT
ncbi:MAG: ABC transporter ATP-binding protein [Candidatus Levybacteria bacterium]|nr:ABC transporter ATP-binding protein [Candidatus Levybacteria bacterium]